MVVIAYLIERNIHAVSETVFGYQCWEKYFVFKILVVLKNNLIYLFLAVLGFHCCEGFSLVATSKGYSCCSAQAPQGRGFSFTEGRV